MKSGPRPPYTTAKPASNLQRPAPLPTNGLRNFLIFFLLLVGAFAAYAYTKNPVGSQKVVADARVVVISLMPGHAAATDAPIVGASYAATDVTPASAPSEPVASPAVAPLTGTQASAPPGPSTSSATTSTTVNGTFPAQPNWTWTTIDGKTYNDVVITNVEGETVSISHAAGVSHLPMSLLPDDVKNRLNYHPATAPAP